MNEQGTMDAGEAAPPLFREVQQFRIWMFWLPIVVVTALVWWQFYQQVIRDNPQGTSPVPDWVAWTLTIVFGLGLPLAGLLLRLVVEIRPDELRVRVYPFNGTRLALADITEAEVREYQGQREYGGWGVRTSNRSGKAYTAYGKEGVQLWLKGDQRMLIGSQKADDLAVVLRAAGVFVR
jgi:hypothetical protein